MNWSKHNLVMPPAVWQAVSGMSPGSRGAYLLLAIEQWVSGGPVPVLRVVEIVGRPWAELPEAVRGLFLKDNGAIGVAWVEEYRAKRLEFLARQQANGSLGGRPPSKVKRRAQRAKKPGITALPVGQLEWPTWTTDKFKKAWEDWKAYRKEQHKFSFSARGEQAALRLYARHCSAEGQALWLMEEAMAGGWMAPVWDHASNYQPKDKGTRWG